jgi:hypothetical protein
MSGATKTSDDGSTTPATVRTHKSTENNLFAKRASFLRDTESEFLCVRQTLIVDRLSLIAFAIVQPKQLTHFLDFELPINGAYF